MGSTFPWVPACLFSGSSLRAITAQAHEWMTINSWQTCLSWSWANEETVMAYIVECWSCQCLHEEYIWEKKILPSHGSRCEAEGQTLSFFVPQGDIVFWAFRWEQDLGTSPIVHAHSTMFPQWHAELCPNCCYLNENILESSHSFSFLNQEARKKQAKSWSQSFRDGSHEGAISTQSGRSE